jgi:hypothetical protein
VSQSERGALEPRLRSLHAHHPLDAPVLHQGQSLNPHAGTAASRSRPQRSRQASASRVRIRVRPR